MIPKYLNWKANQLVLINQCLFSNLPAARHLLPSHLQSLHSLFYFVLCLFGLFNDVYLCYHVFNLNNLPSVPSFTITSTFFSLFVKINLRFLFQVHLRTTSALGTRRSTWPVSGSSSLVSSSSSYRTLKTSGSSATPRSARTSSPTRNLELGLL